MTTRTQFFDHYWAELARLGMDAVILHSWRDMPEKISSDVDFAVTGCKSTYVISHLIDFCETHNWYLVQVIEHEPDAFYCVCMNNGGDRETLALDFTFDYRRLGHLLIRSHDLHEGSYKPTGKKFHVPSPGAELAYLLAKAAAKNKPFQDISSRLDELLKQDYPDCLKKLDTILKLRLNTSLNHGDLLEEIEQWFTAADAFKKIRSGRKFGAKEIWLYSKRIFQPTGLRLKLTGYSECMQDIDWVLNSIAPLFRRCTVIKNNRLISKIRSIALVIKTSLIVDTNSRSVLGCKDWTCSVVCDEKTNHKDIRDAIIKHMNTRIKRRYR